MSLLVKFLFALCNVLLVPVIIVLLVFLGWLVVLAGGFFRECVARSSTRRTLDRCLAAAKEGRDKAQVWSMVRTSRSGVLAAFSKLMAHDAAPSVLLEHTISELEHKIADSMARLALVTRVGPMLGLMGTLIPLGPALAGLASGDMQVMAGNLIVAFTTTVIGVLVGSVAYGIGLIRRTWYARDLTDLEFICQYLAGED